MIQSTPTNITLRTVPAIAGWHWITRGWVLLKANPIHIHMAVFFFLGALGILSILPIVGSVAAALLMPALYLGVMTTISQAERTDSKQAGALLDALGKAFRKDANGVRSGLKRLAGLGFVYALAIITLIGAYSVIDDGEAFKVLVLGQPLPNEVQARAVAISGLAGVFVIYAPLSMAFWFTQQLVGWHSQPISKAVFFSWYGCWRNKTAFAVYGIAWLGIFMVCSLLIVALATLFGSPNLAGILLTPLSLFLMVWVMCSFYASYESLVQVLD